jgi:hypothetical protein
MKSMKHLEEEMAILDDMIDALVELLEKKGIITTKEWETRIREKIEERVLLG